MVAVSAVADGSRGKSRNLRLYGISQCYDDLRALEALIHCLPHPLPRPRVSLSRLSGMYGSWEQPRSILWPWQAV